MPKQHPHPVTMPITIVNDQYVVAQMLTRPMR